MKRLMLIFLVLLLVSSAAMVSADPVDELTTLAQYAPADTILFATIRTDDAFFEEIDVLLLAAINKFPMDMLPAEGVSIYDALNDYDYSTSDYSERDFRANIRPWLGDHVAMVIPSMDTLNDRPTYIYEVTDFDAAKAFLDTGLVSEEGGFSYYAEPEAREDGSFLYTSEYSFDPNVLLTEDLLFVGRLETGIETLVMPGEDAVSLDQTSEFQDALAALPLDDYNIAAYLNPQPLIEIAANEMARELSQQGIDLDFDQIADAAGQLAFGATLLGDRSLVMDVANTGAFPLEFAPLNLDMLDLVPADAPLVVQGSGFGSLARLALDGMYQLDDYLKAQGVLPIPDAGFLGELGPDDLATFARLSAEGTYQIDLEETLAWMSGDFVSYVRLVENADSPIGILPEMGFVMSTDNPESTAQLVAGIGQLAQNAFAPTTVEDGTVTVPLGQLFSVPELFTVKVTSNDEYFIYGTETSVDYALDPSGDSITTTEHYGFESALFLPDPFSLWYVDFAPIRAAFAAFMETMPLVPEDDAAMLSSLLEVVNTASITGSQGEDGNLSARLTLTLGE